MHHQHQRRRGQHQCLPEAPPSRGQVVHIDVIHIEQGSLGPQVPAELSVCAILRDQSQQVSAAIQSLYDSLRMEVACGGQLSRVYRPSSEALNYQSAYEQLHN